jgi:hypothetical protein
MDPFTPEPFQAVRIDLYTSAYRVSGTIQTRFTRITDILNQVSANHLLIGQSTISEYDDPSATLSANQVYIALDQVLFGSAAVDATARPEMRVPKRPIKAQIAIPPFRLTGTVHVTQGSRPAEALLNSTDRFLPMTEVTIVSATHAELGRQAPAIAVQKRLAHVLLIADDERPDELLADVLDEKTAQEWLATREPPGVREPPVTG